MLWDDEFAFEKLFVILANAINGIVMLPRKENRDNTT
jgi:hypothetical protein